MKLVLKKQHDITGFAGTDESRYVLLGVHYNKSKNRLEATDGRLMVWLPVDPKVDDRDLPPVKPAGVKSDDSPADCIIPSNTLREAIEKATSKEWTVDVLGHVVFETSSQNMSPPLVALSSTDLDRTHTVISKTHDGDYPNMQSLIDDAAAKPVKFKIALSPYLLKKFAEYAIRNSTECKSIEFRFTGELDAARITIPLKDGGVLSGLLMPMRNG